MSSGIELQHAAVGALTVALQSMLCHGLQTALNVSEGEVEVWIVRAIGKKLLDARIDQLGEWQARHH